MLDLELEEIGSLVRSGRVLSGIPSIKRAALLPANVILPLSSSLWYEISKTSYNLT